VATHPALPDGSGRPWKVLPIGWVQNPRPIRKPITVAFRGSVTAKDFTQDAKVRLCFVCLAGEITHAQYFCGSSVLNLLKSFRYAGFLFSDFESIRIAEDARDMIGPHLILRMKDSLMVHLGFRQYLYGNGTTETANINADIKEAESGEKEITSEDKKQYQVILDMVSAVLKYYPGYELSVCRHSLG
jgi:hypothetical protein